jgi:hypothetical protein
LLGNADAWAANGAMQADATDSKRNRRRFMEGWSPVFY